MPSATHFQSPTPFSKKRRRDENGDAPLAFTTTINTPSPPYDQQPPYRDPLGSHDRRNLYQAGLDRGLGVTRKLSTLPSTKRVRKDSSGGFCQGSGPRPPSIPVVHRSTRPMPPDIQSIVAQPDTPWLGAAARLSPCHICHRRPSKKSDLDSYANCQGCGQRTCYVCIRSCQGWLPALASVVGTSAEEKQDRSASFPMHDVDDEETASQDDQSWQGSRHRIVVCSRCCVERGSEGDVVCLGCLAGMEGA